MNSSSPSLPPAPRSAFAEEWSSPRKQQQQRPLSPSGSDTAQGSQSSILPPVSTKQGHTTVRGRSADPSKSGTRNARPVTAAVSPSHSSSDVFRQQRIKERTYDVNLVTRNMPVYEPLLDESLQHYFNIPCIREHLVSLGIVDKEGFIIEERAFKYKQLELDRAEKEAYIKRLGEQREIDREVEVTLRQGSERAQSSSPRKLRGRVGDVAKPLRGHYPIINPPKSPRRSAKTLPPVGGTVAKTDDEDQVQQAGQSDEQAAAGDYADDGFEDSPEAAAGSTSGEGGDTSSGAAHARPGSAYNKKKSTASLTNLSHDPVSEFYSEYSDDEFESTSSIPTAKTQSAERLTLPQTGRGDAPYTSSQLVFTESQQFVASDSDAAAQEQDQQQSSALKLPAQGLLPQSLETLYTSSQLEASSNSQGRLDSSTGSQQESLQRQQQQQLGAPRPPQRDSTMQTSQPQLVDTGEQYDDRRLFRDQGLQMSTHNLDSMTQTSSQRSREMGTQPSATTFDQQLQTTTTTGETQKKQTEAVSVGTDAAPSEPEAKSTDAEKAAKKPDPALLQSYSDQLNQAERFLRNGDTQATRRTCKVIEAGIKSSGFQETSTDLLLAQAYFVDAQAAYMQKDYSGCEESLLLAFQRGAADIEFMKSLIVFKHQIMSEEESARAKSVSRSIPESALQGLTKTERLLIDQLSALGGDVESVLRQVRLNKVRESQGVSTPVLPGSSSGQSVSEQQRQETVPSAPNEAEGPRKPPGDSPRKSPSKRGLSGSARNVSSASTSPKGSKTSLKGSTATLRQEPSALSVQFASPSTVQSTFDMGESLKNTETFIERSASKPLHSDQSASVHQEGQETASELPAASPAANTDATHNAAQERTPGSNEEKEDVDPSIVPLPASLAGSRSLLNDETATMSPEERLALRARGSQESIAIRKTGQKSPSPLRRSAASPPHGSNPSLSPPRSLSASTSVAKSDRALCAKSDDKLSASNRQISRPSAMASSSKLRAPSQVKLGGRVKSVTFAAADEPAAATKEVDPASYPLPVSEAGSRAVLLDEVSRRLFNSQSDSTEPVQLAILVPASVSTSTILAEAAHQPEDQELHPENFTLPESRAESAAQSQHSLHASEASASHSRLAKAESSLSNNDLSAALSTPLPESVTSSQTLAGSGTAPEEQTDHAPVARRTSFTGSLSNAVKHMPTVAEEEPCPTVEESSAFDASKVPLPESVAASRANISRTTPAGSQRGSVNALNLPLPESVSAYQNLMGHQKSIGEDQSSAQKQSQRQEYGSRNAFNVPLPASVAGSQDLLGHRPPKHAEPKGRQQDQSQQFEDVHPEHFPLPPSVSASQALLRNSHPSLQKDADRSAAHEHHQKPGGASEAANVPLPDSVAASQTLLSSGRSTEKLQGPSSLEDFGGATDVSWDSAKLNALLPSSGPSLADTAATARGFQETQPQTREDSRVEARDAIKHADPSQIALPPSVAASTTLFAADSSDQSSVTHSQQDIREETPVDISQIPLPESVQASQTLARSSSVKDDAKQERSSQQELALQKQPSTDISKIPLPASVAASQALDFDEPTEDVSTRHSNEVQEGMAQRSDSVDFTKVPLPSSVAASQTLSESWPKGHLKEQVANSEQEPRIRHTGSLTGLNTPLPPSVAGSKDILASHGPVASEFSYEGSLQAASSRAPDEQTGASLQKTGRSQSQEAANIPLPQSVAASQSLSEGKPQPTGLSKESGSARKEPRTASAKGSATNLSSKPGAGSRNNVTASLSSGGKAAVQSSADLKKASEVPLPPSSAASRASLAALAQPEAVPGNVDPLKVPLPQSHANLIESREEGNAPLTQSARTKGGSLRALNAPHRPELPKSGSLRTIHKSGTSPTRNQRYTVPLKQGAGSPGKKADSTRASSGKISSDTKAQSAQDVARASDPASIPLPASQAELSSAEPANASSNAAQLPIRPEEVPLPASRSAIDLTASSSSLAHTKPAAPASGSSRPRSPPPRHYRSTDLRNVDPHRSSLPTLEEAAAIPLAPSTATFDELGDSADLQTEKQRQEGPVVDDATQQLLDQWNDGQRSASLARLTADTQPAETASAPADRTATRHQQPAEDVDATQVGLPASRASSYGVIGSQSALGKAQPASQKGPAEKTAPAPADHTTSHHENQAEVVDAAQVGLPASRASSYAVLGSQSALGKALPESQKGPGESFPTPADYAESCQEQPAKVVDATQVGLPASRASSYAVLGSQSALGKVQPATHNGTGETSPAPAASHHEQPAEDVDAAQVGLPASHASSYAVMGSQPELSKAQPVSQKSATSLLRKISGRSSPSVQDSAKAPQSQYSARPLAGSTELRRSPSKGSTSGSQANIGNIDPARVPLPASVAVSQSLLGHSHPSTHDVATTPKKELRTAAGLQGKDPDAPVDASQVALPESRLSLSGS